MKIIERKVLRNTNSTAISDEQLRDFMPAAYATEPHKDVTRAYGFFPTYRVIETMHDAGYVPVEARNYAKRDTTARAAARHLLRFRKPTDAPYKRDEVFPEIIMINSHDRSTQFSMYGGLYRVLCGNGLYVSEGGLIKPLYVKHTRNMVKGILENVGLITHNYKRTFLLIDHMMRQKLTWEQQMVYASAVYGAARPKATLDVSPALLLGARRDEDKQDTLWHTLNRVQENLIRGGMAGTSPNGRRAYTTEINSIKADKQINTAAWEIAMATIRKASRSSKTRLLLEEA